MIGKTLLHYEITGALGVGGMGEVYRALDTKLDREVAIKVLPEQMTRDPERVARFQREARTLASLNHPNIAGLFGFEHDGEQRFLVMELVEGETLAERIQRGPIALDDVLDIARQIADGLEEAHEKGIVHRDLKPANIKLTPDDKVKILDFGLARAYQGDGVEESSIENSPTITAAMTQQGMILGTAAYMSPEQAKGKTVDRRADLWSFGVVLWEMITGQRLFSGETTSDTLAAVLRAEPPYDELPDATPDAVRRMLERCLERDPRKRLRDIGEARVRLERWRDDPTTMSGVFTAPEVAADRNSIAAAAPWIIAVLALGAALWATLAPRSASVENAAEPGVDLTTEIELAHESGLQVDIDTNVKISPDGSTLAYIADNAIWIRTLDELEPRRLSGSEQATSVAISPDGQWLAFFARGRLFRTSITGGAPFDLSEAGDPRGLDWVDDATLIYSPGITGGLWTLSIEDGTTKQITQLDTSRNERSHRWPRRMPDGKSVVFIDQFFGNDYDQSDIQIVSLESGERHTIYRGGAAPRILSSGHLVFARKNTLFATGFDLDSQQTVGSAVPILEEIWTSIGDQESCDGSAQFDISENGTLIYRQGSGGIVADSRIVRVNFASGRSETLTQEAARFATPLLSPDGKYLAYCVENDRRRDIFLMETATGLSRQLTFATEGSWLGCWSPDSKTLYWSRSTVSSRHSFFRQPADGSAAEEMFYQAEQTAYPTSISPDQKTLFYTVWADADTWDVRQMSLEDPSAPSQPVLVGPGMQLFSVFSPDGKWLSYIDGTASTSKAYLTPYPPTGARWEIADNSVSKIDWSPDGSYIYGRNASGFFRRSIGSSLGSLHLGQLEPRLSDNFVRSSSWWTTATLPDGSGAYAFDSVDASSQDQAVRIILETNWVERRLNRAP